jgi:chorismate mutase
LFCFDEMRVVFVWLLVLVLMGCAGPGKESRGLPGLMVERLSWMDEVAMVKLAKDLPVEDPAREAALLEAMAVAGAEMGLPSTAVRGFFAGQILAAKVRQEEWLRTRSSDAVASLALPDLAGTVRPALDAIGKRMLVALVEVRESGKSWEVKRNCRERLVRAGFSEQVIEAAMEGLEVGLREAR